MTPLNQYCFLILLSIFLSCNGSSGNSGNTTTPPGNTQPPTPQPIPPSGGNEGNTENPPEVEPKVMIRKNIYTWATNGPEMTAYKKGIAAMKSRAATDPTSWSYQAAIHGTIKEPEKEAWNQCQHQSFFFLSWHRMYLYYFERILRKASGDPNFTLPYWNYSNESERAISRSFSTTCR